MYKFILIITYLFLLSSCYFHSTAELYYCNVSADSLVRLIQEYKTKYPESNFKTLDKDGNLISWDRFCSNGAGSDVYACYFTIVSKADSDTMTFGCRVRNHPQYEFGSFLVLRSVKDRFHWFMSLHGKWPSEKSIERRTLFEKQVMDSLQVKWVRE